MPVDKELAFRRQLFAKQHFDECRLARTADTDNEDKFALANFDIDMIERNDAVIICL